MLSQTWAVNQGVFMGIVYHEDLTRYTVVSDKKQTRMSIGAIINTDTEAEVDSPFFLSAFGIEIVDALKGFLHENSSSVTDGNPVGLVLHRD